MRRLRHSIPITALVLVIAACGGDATTATTVASSTTEPATSSTTTIAATTTTTTTTTTLPADTHPVFGLRWEDAWPAAGMTATYSVTKFGGEQIELPARMEYGVEFAGGTYDRLVVGAAEPGSETDGMVVYFDRSEPWQITIVGEEVFRAGDASPESVYVFETPVVFDGLAPIGETRRTDGQLSLTIGDGTVLDLGVTYDVTLRDIENVTVLAGEFDDVLVVDVEVGGELLGGDFTFPLEMWLDAHNLFVNYTGASGFDLLELLEPWS